MKKLSTLCQVMFALVCLLPFSAQAAPTLVSPSPASFGEVERITLKDPADVYSAGVMVAGGVEMILPRNLLIDLPANRLSLQQIFDQAPAACKALGESGLAKADRCNGSGSGAIATLSAVRSNAGNVIVGDLFLAKASEVVHGRVSYINYNQGFYRVNGIDNDPNTGVMVRLNDPTSRHTIQSGLGCAGGPNCSPDPRFTLDPDNYTNTFATGYPMCIPSTVARSFTNPLGGPTVSQAAANGTGDYLCPNTNRSPGVINEPAVADSRRFAPVIIGDSVMAEGNYETIGGVRFLSAHTSSVQKALSTRNAAGQPDYLMLEEVGTEAPPFQNQRLVNLFIGFTTLAPTDVDIWSIHRDPVTNEAHEFPYASVSGCDNASGGPGECSSQGLLNAGANIWKINYRTDFNKGPDPRLSPCAHLLASRFASSHPGLCAGGSSHASDFGVLSPSPHEIIARTGRKITSPAGSLITIDVNGNEATNGEYLFPLGLNLGGLGVAEMSEVDINVLDTPLPFEGIPWNLDRRLGPSGCLNAGGCEPGAVGSAAFALDPFPYSGLEPRLQSPGLPTGSYSDPVFNTAGNPLSNIRNRMFSYVNASGRFNGNATLLPYVLGSFPADPPLITINPTPVFNIFPPIAGADTASTKAGVPVSINVLANDTPILGTIDQTSVKIASAPASGSAVVTASGAITYTPAANASGTISFSYTVANNFGAVSQPGTVTVSIVSAPVAVNDAASVPAGTSQQINLTANDLSGTGILNIASVTITSTATCGTLVNQLDGIVLFSAPPAIPAGGTCSFGYLVGDASAPPLLSNAATVTVTVTAANPGNTAPVAANDFAAALTGATVIINVVGNDTATAPGTINPASLVLDTPTGGTALANSNGTVSYTAPGTAGTYVFSYTVKDNQALPVTSNPALVVVTVTAAVAPVLPPAAVNNTASTPINTTVSIAVLANDTAGTNPINPATVAIGAAAAHGSTVVNNLTGAVTYTPSAGYSGPDSFTYTVQDTTGLSSNPATVALTVTPQSISVTRAQFTANGGAWRVDGTVTPAPPVGTTMTIFNNTTVDGGTPLPLVANIPINNLGAWTWSSGNQNTSTLNAQRRISVRTSQTPPATLQGINVRLR